MKRRRVLVTGATSGIGSETALAFARAGWNVIAHYSSAQSTAERLRLRIRRCKIDCLLVRADFTSSEQVASLIKTVGRYRIDSLINNAGSYVADRLFSELTFDDFQAALAVNVVAPGLLSAHLFGSMKERGFGRIVNISSIAAKYGGSARSLHYGCSKRALEGLTRTLAREGAPRNVLVNTIRPGVIDTAFHKKFPKDMEQRIAMIPMRKMGRAEDVAEMAFYLGSERNGFITNEVITIAGGE